MSDKDGIVWSGRIDLSKCDGYFTSFDMVTGKMRPAYEHGDGRYRWDSCRSIVVEWPWEAKIEEDYPWPFQPSVLFCGWVRVWETGNFLVGPMTWNLSFWEAYRA